jgi:hypothetical protein
MSLLPGLGALLLAGASFLACFAVASGRALALAVRVLAALGAVALLPAATGAAARPGLVLVIAAVALPRPVSLLVATAAAAAVALGAPLGTASPPLAALVAAVAAAVVAAAVSASAEARLSLGTDAGWAAAAGGLALVAAVAGLGGVRVLHWSFIAGAADAALRVPQVGVLLGLTGITALGGSLVLVAQLTTGSPSSLARLSGQRALLLATGYAVLAIGFALARLGSHGPAALAEHGLGLAALVLGLGVLAWGLLLLLGEARGDAAQLEAQAARQTRVALVLALVAAGLGVAEAWWQEGSYAAPSLALALAPACLGLAALQPTRFATLRRGAFLLGVLSALC